MSRFLQILAIACLTITLCAAEAPLRYRSRSGRLQLSKQRSRFLARQEVADEASGAVTPYPSAKELIPDVPFDETASAAAGDSPVDADAPVDVNDAPAFEVAEEEEDEPAAADDAAEGDREPDLIYGPPEVEDVPTINEVPIEEVEQTIAEEEEQAAAAEEQFQSGRLLSGRRNNAARRYAARPAKLRGAPSSFAARATSAKALSAKSAKIVKAKVVSKARSARLQQQQPQPQTQFFVPQQFAALQQQPAAFFYTTAHLQQF